MLNPQLVAHGIGIKHRCCFLRLRVSQAPDFLTESHLPYLEQVCSLFVLEFGRNLQKFVHSQENPSMAL